MMPWLALLPAAVAAPLEVAVGGLDAPTAVHVLVGDGDAVMWADCNDAGVAPDAAPDGVWQCGGGDWPAERASIALLVDGRLKPAGVATWTGGERRVSIEVAGGSVGLSTEQDLHRPAAGAPPAGPGRTLIVRIPDYPSDGAPVLRLRGPSAAAEMNCGDDGRFPDRERNDHELACAGVIPAGERVSVTLLPPGAPPVDLGEISPPGGPLSQWRLDLDGPTIGAVELDALAIAFAGPSDRPDDPPPHPGEGQPAGGPPPPEGLSEPVAGGGPEGPAPFGGAGGGGCRRPGLPDSGVMAFGLAALMVAGGVAAGRRRGGRRDPLAPLQVVPSPPLFDGGPSLSLGGAWLASPDPAALAGALVAALAPTRRVVVASTDALTLAAPVGASTYAVVRPHIDDLAEAIVALAERPGPEVAVLLVGPDPLLTPGEIGPDAALELERRLPPGVFLAELVGADAPPSAWLPRFRVEGPPWRGVAG